MERILTKQLLGALIKNGYRYFLYKTSSADCRDATVEITLKPVKTHPLLHRLPAPYQRYYKISQELLHLAKGMPGVRISVELTREEQITEEPAAHRLEEYSASS